MQTEPSEATPSRPATPRPRAPGAPLALALIGAACAGAGVWAVSAEDPAVAAAVAAAGAFCSASAVAGLARRRLRRIGAALETAGEGASGSLEARVARLAEDALRLRAGLESCASMVMLADADGVIFYAHPRLTALFAAHQERFAAQFPEVTFPDVVGSPIAAFEAGVKTLSTGAGGAAGDAALVVAGGRMLRVLVAPVAAPDGRVVGTLTRWDDATNEFEIENEVNNMVEMVSIGELDMQMAVPEGAGAYAKVATAINGLVETLKGTLQEIAEMLGGMSRGDLSRKIESDFMGVFGELAAHANATLDQVSATVRDIRGATTGVNAAVGAIRCDATQLAERADEAAMILAETASAAAALAESFAEMAGHARDAESLAQGTRQTAKKCDAVATASTAAMAAIQRSAAKVNEIASVIDEIAFQTNMLALNAAVEAARAGDAGRGFAVVAQEVRALSQRVARSAADIKSLLKASDAEIDRGVALARDSATALNVIERDVGKVVDLIERICGASDHQTRDMQQMEGSLSRLAEITQENSTGAGATADAVEKLAALAAGLAEAVDFFGEVAEAAAPSAGPGEGPALIDGHNPFDDGDADAAVAEMLASLEAMEADAADDGPVQSPSWATDGVTGA